MTTYCQVCGTTSAAKKTADWQCKHLPSCRVNHTGSSGLMEVEAAKVMWSRSMDRGLRYTTIVSDWDSKTFNALTELKPYSVEVCKEECTNHVSKRLGTALRNLVSTEAKKGKTLGGRKAGSLTQFKISLLQSYYKKAVASRCSSVGQLRSKIWQAFFHSASTDCKPQHQECPKGASSWCFWQRAIAHGKTPPSHNGKSSSFISDFRACSQCYEANLRAPYNG